MADHEEQDPVLRTATNTRPIPDPTELTDAAIARLEKAIHQYVDGQVEVLQERLSGMDRATELRLVGIRDIPDSIDLRVGHLNTTMEEKFSSIQTQFTERDTRQERESRDNKVAVDAAFAAQKEAAAKQDESNQKAIDKSEKATNETIKTNAELFKTTTDSLRENINDLKDRLANTEAAQVSRLSAVENRVTAAQSNKEGGREQLTALYAMVGFILALVTIGGLLAVTGVFTK